MTPATPMGKTTGRTMNVLVLCTGNSARSILAECIFNHHSDGTIKAYSAGSNPTGIVHPLAIKALGLASISAEGLRSKSWDEFSSPSAPNMDLVITVCDNAAKETCPIWPGAPVSVHWGLPDPVMIDASQTQMSAAFEGTVSRLNSMVKETLSLPIQDMSVDELKAALIEIGNNNGAQTNQ